MSTLATITELRAMQAADLRKEIRAQQSNVRKMRLQITMNTEKDTGRYRREKRQLARMMMALGEKVGTEPVKAKKTEKQTLKKTPAKATVSVSKTSKKS